jgi:hypothetical protein
LGLAPAITVTSTAATPAQPAANRTVLTAGFAWLNAATGIGLRSGCSISGLPGGAVGQRTAFLLAAAFATLGQRWLSNPVTSASSAAQP